MAAKKPPIADEGADDAYCDGDDDISFDQVEDVAIAFAALDKIEDPDERKAATREYFAEMSAEATTTGDAN